MSITAGIIAAGEGSRLAGQSTVKPLISVAGRPLIHWVVEGLRFAGAVKITVITNSKGTAVPPSLKASFKDQEFDFITADTASSFETFRLAALRMAETNQDFMISTTDALIKPEDVRKFVASCRASRCDAGLALTAFVDDEKPLWADVDEVGLVTGLGADAKTKRFVTCGLYFMTKLAAGRLPAAAEHTRLRDYLSSLTATLRVAGVVLSKTLDVDRPSDLTMAEQFLTVESPK